jgi:hypothetical protein
LNKKNKEINRKDDEPTQIGNTTNNLYVGTTADLQRLLQEEKGMVIDAESEGKLPR